MPYWAISVSADTGQARLRSAWFGTVPGYSVRVGIGRLLGVLPSLLIVLVLAADARLSMVATVPVNSTIAVSPGSVQRAEFQQCRSAVTALLGNELLKVASGRPDAGAATVELINHTYRNSPLLLARIQRAENRLLLTAARDLLDTFDMDVTSELAGYGGRIALACGPA